MANRFGPSRGELWFRLGFSLVGLAGLAVMLAYRGMPGGPGLIEVVAIPLILFGITAILSARKLIKRDHPPVKETDDAL